MTVCPACGNTIGTDERFCRVCGRQVGDAPVAVPPGPIAGGPAETSGRAIASLVFGVFLFFFPFSIVAIIFGHLSLSDIRKSAGRLTGRGLAIAGLVLGYAGVAFIPLVLIIAAIAIPNFLRARIAANESSAVAGVRAVITAETSYAEAHPDEGYTCSFATLAQAGMLSGGIVQGQKNGYVYELSACTSEGLNETKRGFQIVAYPLRENQTGVRAFCANESGVVKMDSGGSPQRCLENGTKLE